MFKEFKNLDEDIIDMINGNVTYAHIHYFMIDKKFKSGNYKQMIYESDAREIISNKRYCTEFCNNILRSSIPKSGLCSYTLVIIESDGKGEEIIYSAIGMSHIKKKK